MSANQIAITICHSPKNCAESAKAKGWQAKKTRDGWLVTSSDGKQRTLFVRR